MNSSAQAVEAFEPDNLPIALVVDDDFTNVVILTALLEKEGYKVNSANNGVQALEQFDQQQPDIVFMDVLMPVMDGLEATRQIKERSNDWLIPVIFLTALSDDDDLAKCIEVGGDDFISKPINSIVFKAKLTAAERMRDMYRMVHDQHARLVRDEELAEQVFSRVVEAKNEALEEIEFLRRSAGVFSGDVFLSQRNPSGSLYMLLGDFTGHGLSAALGALPTAEIFRAMVSKGHQPTEIIAEINKKLHRVLPTGLFLAAVFIVIDEHEHSLSLWNGGLPDVLLIDKDGDIKKRISSSYLPLGIVPEIEDNHSTWIQLDPDDHLLVHTDGLLEMHNAAGEMFGISRLEQIFRQGGDTAAIKSRIIQAIDTFPGTDEQEDDISFVLLQYDAREKPGLRSFPNEQLDGRQPQENIIEQRGYQELWSWTLDLDTNSLKRLDVIPFILTHLDQLYGLGAHRNKLFTILAELFNNALDHGILGLDSKMKQTPEGFMEYIELRKRRLNKLENGKIALIFRMQESNKGNILCIGMEDSGPGFDYRAQQQKSDSSTETQYCGRGITLVKQFCDSIEYHGAGNRVEAVYVCADQQAQLSNSN